MGTIRDPSLRITYTDGTSFDGRLSQWNEARGDGVDAILAADTNFSGQSIYYCHRDGCRMCFRVGAFTITRDVINELVIPYEASKPLRQLRRIYPPDLFLVEVKTGWWRRGDIHLV